MKVEYFIGIVPPEEYLERIEHFQSKWIKQSGVEPHITLKAQGGLTPDKKWIDKVQKVCETFKPFQVSLDKPKYFGDNILYLSVNSNNLPKLHQEIVQEISPSEDLIKQYYELDAFVPHLTLGKEQYGGNISTGLSKKELKEMERLAGKELTPYPHFEVNFIRVYELNIEKQRYEKYSDISLNN
ncbi:2'-5' RNA ligase family protein [Rossellomorea vietnamensis]|uniref:2'-5' RNA ligase family protein n=1 Tax=Rossellomorea vietnamensis TaxID=218284 RepID=A0A5D4NTK3_9BACI|nr:2'-5' RNA ligase family protein [Rossellomorea vietnamensis]TYS16656.1 2'-5' RNA ligase family protein [Rossellomorea vietnamensis]